LIHSSRVPAELPPPAVLEPLTAFAAENSEKFKVHVFVDAQDGSNSPVPIPHINTGRITDFALERCLRSKQLPGSWWQKLFHKNVSEDERPRRTLFLVCGPEPMIGVIAGPYGRNFSQGTVAGILGRMGIASDCVYKL